MGSASIDITLAGQSFTLTAQAALIWPRRKTLIIADLHLGKSETLASAGIPIPPGVLGHDLTRLEAILRQSHAERILILGDLLHAPAGLAPALIDQVANWQSRNRIEWSLIPGNHDRRIDKVAAAWNLSIHPAAIIEDGIGFCHDPHRTDPTLRDAQFTWCGHIHPIVRLKGNGDRLALPCYHLTPNTGILPAFSWLTGGAPIDTRDPTTQTYALADNHLMPIHNLQPPRS